MIRYLKKYLMKILRFLDRFLFGDWKIMHLDDNGIFILQKNTRRFEYDDFIITDNRIKSAFEKWYLPYQQKEFIAKIKNAYIEPKYGFIITKRNELLIDSLKYSLINPLPLKIAFFLQRVFLRKRRFSTIFSLRERGSENYSHFFEEFLPKYWMSEQNEETAQYPKILSPQISSQSFFKEFIQWNVLSKKDFVIQNGFLIEAKCIYFNWAFDYDVKNLEVALSCLPSRGLIEKNASKRYFIVRGQKYENKRDLLNRSDIIEIARKYGFETVDPGALVFKDQIKLFNRANFLIGVHGAALTNMLFSRRNSPKLIELFPSNYINLIFNRWAKIYDFTYRVIVGEQYQKENRFYIDPILFEKTLTDLLIG